mgnify:FL=1
MLQLAQRWILPIWNAKHRQKDGQAVVKERYDAGGRKKTDGRKCHL